MADQQTIAVFGATGAQGGGLVRAILADKSGAYRARAITRNPTSDKAKALAASGVQVVAGDADQPETLAKALEGAQSVFCVTNFWEHMIPERELAQASAMARATRQAGAKHVVWSTLEDTRKYIPLSDSRLPTLKGKYKVPHFDAKGEADAVFASEGAPTSYMLVAFYWDNFIYFGLQPRRGADGVLAISLPLGGQKLPGIAVQDVGKCALGIFRKGAAATAGKSFGISGENLSGEQMAAAFTKTLGEKVAFNDVPFDVYRGFGFPGADDMGNMFQFQQIRGAAFLKERDPGLSRELNPELLTFDAWLAANAARIPRE